MNKRDPKLEIEPLSDVSWQRIERGVMNALDAEAAPVAAPPERPRRWAVGFVLAGAAAAVLAIVSWRLVDRRPGAEPSRIVTAESATRVAYGEASLEVAARSELLVHGDDER